MNSKNYQARGQSKPVASGRYFNDRLMISRVVLNSCFLDTVFVIFPRTAAETAISKVHKLLRIDGPPPTPNP